MPLTAKQQQQLNEILGSRLRDITMSQARELALIVGPVLALIAGAIWLALQFVEPAPPKHLTIATGSPSGAYYAFGKRYADSLKKAGITLDVQATDGSLDNVKRLLDPASGIDVALLQGGVINSREAPKLVSLGRLFVEPLWVFYRSGETIDRLHQLRGRRIAVGPEGSGTRKLAMQLLGANSIDAGGATLLPITGQAAADALVKGDADAIVLALAPEAPLLQSLIRMGDIKLMSFAQGEAYTRLFPFLQKIVLPQGAIDLVRNIPAEDVTLIAPVAALVARETLHPALAGLLIDAAREVHAGGGLFHRVGDFPKPLDPELDLSSDAERYYKSGPSFLKRFLPFWLATFIERMSIIAVPLAGAIVPLVKGVPALYKWRVRRRIFHWYGRLKALEASVAADQRGERLEGHREEVNHIAEAVSTIPVPLNFADQYYTLRSAIDLVRQRLNERAVLATNATLG